jgi:tRNA-specific 2-thiouridylase
MKAKSIIMVALSGGVDSAVAAYLLREQGHAVQCLHMTNWEDGDGYCAAAEDAQDARRIARHLDLPLHRANFAPQYRAQVFEDFLREHERGRTPNPDVLCNREIKFGVLKDYAVRLGAAELATGHYARLSATGDNDVQLLKGRDPNKDQSYFLHAVSADALAGVRFPLGELNKTEVREQARTAGIPVSGKKDSTGICFIGERPFAEFLSGYLADSPGPIKSAAGDVLAQHRGLAFYTLGQRQGLGIGGVKAHSEEAWYVAEKRFAANELIVVQGGNHPLLYADSLTARAAHWIGRAPAALQASGSLRCAAKIRYRQADQPCRVSLREADVLDVIFDRPQRSVTPGQFVVFYDSDRCLGGAVIDTAGTHRASAAVQTA